MMQKKNTKKDILISLFIVLFTILLSFNILLFSTNYHKDIIKTYQTNTTFYEIDKNVTMYVSGFDKSLNAPFNENEINHLKDVRNLIIIEEIIFLLSIILFIILIFKKQIRIFFQLKICAIIIIIILILLLILMPYFDKFFISFHKLFFPNGNWMFPSESLMIQTYNQIFFEKFFFYTFVISAFIIIITYILSEILKNWIIVTKKENNE